MSISEMLTDGGGIVLIILTLVQVAPVKVNPWSWIARTVGRAMNADMMEALKESNAKACRYRIIRFDDEIRHRTLHTQEHFSQIIDDIDEYERYCSGHKEFKNNKAMAAIKNVKDVYEQCRRENTFL